MDNISALLGQRIRVLRTSAGLSQEDLAFKASISTNYLGQVERAVKNPTLETVYRIAQALDISLIQLFDFENAIIASNEQSTITNKIIAQLSSISDEQRQDILKLIKIFKHYHEND